MADSTQEKKIIKLIIKEVSKKLSKECKVILKQKSVIEDLPNGLKLHGISDDNKYGVIVCNNKSLDGKIKAGQRNAIFEKCYLLMLSRVENKILLFTDKDFYNKFVEKYEVYLKDIKHDYFDISQLNLESIL